MKAEGKFDVEVDKKTYSKQDKLESILKWPGGKESELKYILPALPKNFENYFEPFVGGGSVYKSINAKNYYINDKSDELITFYKMIAEKNIIFFDAIKGISSAWISISEFAQTNYQYLITLYHNYRNGKWAKLDIVRLSGNFIDDNIKSLANIFAFHSGNVAYDIETLKKVLSEKIFRIKVIEDKNDKLVEQDIFQNLETAFKAAYYNFLRNLYNSAEILALSKPIRISLFYFLRNFAYSGMFRYSLKGNFNVPYGGIGYNRNNLLKKIDYFLSDKLQKHLSRTRFESSDFEDFFTKSKPGKHDFIFLDPPYDSDFSTYANNIFSRPDQKRLAEYLLHKCKAKWMMIINNTDFIYSLYNNNEKLNITPFDKKYLVSFMNRNDKMAEHLLIKNY